MEQKRDLAATLAALGIVDPRGIQSQEPAVPAARPATLAGSRLLLLDNKKLGTDYGPFAVIWDALRENIPEAAWEIAVDDLTKYPDDQIEAAAGKLIAQHKPHAMVIALADAGVSLPTVLLAVALERQGMATVTLATVLGSRVMRGVFEALAPDLDPVILETVRTDTPEHIAGLVKANIGAIRDGLTKKPGGVAASGSGSAAPMLDQSRTWDDVADGMHEFQDWLEYAGIGDGLPLIPATKRAIEAQLRHANADPDEILLGPVVSSGRALRVRDAAANAVMTSCPPRAFPVIIAALRAVAQPEFRLSWMATTANPSGTAVLYSGPKPERFGLTGGPGCLGPGPRTNASVGRAVALSISSVFGARPGGVDLTGFGSPAEFTYCLAEDVEASPWPSLADEIGGGKPGVLVVKAEGPRNVLEHQALTPIGLCEAFAGTATGVGSNGSYVPGDLILFINPEHARIFSEAGWTRSDVAHAIYEMARISRKKIAGHGIRATRPPFMSVLHEEVPIVRSPSDVRIIVAGGETPHSMVALAFTFSRGQWHGVDA